MIFVASDVGNGHSQRRLDGLLAIPARQLVEPGYPPGAGQSALARAYRLDRAEGWTSADAAGLAVLPGLVRYYEVFGAVEIQHAFRVTVRATNGHVWPASQGD